MACSCLAPRRLAVRCCHTMKNCAIVIALAIGVIAMTGSSVVAASPGDYDREDASSSHDRPGGRRRLCTKPPAWHPVYSAGWTNGRCRYTVDCDSPGFDSELACCRNAYAGQVSGHCVSMLPSPPTMSPMETGDLDVYYPDYETPWDQAYCINKRPMPSGRHAYSSMLACCKAAYAGQVSGKCISMLPSPPTTSPTNSNRQADFWYPVYEVPWDRSGCSNELPLPYNNINDRPRYSTQEGCCAASYGGQVSRACVCGLPDPPLGCPGIVEYTATTTTATVSSTLTLGEISVPSDPTEKADLIRSLESAIFDIVAASLGSDAGTLTEVKIISIGGQPVLRRLRRRRALDSGVGKWRERRVLQDSTDIEVQSTVERVCSGNCAGDGDAVSNAVLEDVSASLSDRDAVQSAFQASENVAVKTASVRAVTTDSNVKTTVQVKTTIGPPPTRPPTSRPTSKPTRHPSVPPTQPPTSPPSLPLTTAPPSTSPTSPPTAPPSTAPPTAPPSAQLTSPPSTPPPTSPPSLPPTTPPTSSPSTSPPTTSPSTQPTAPPPTPPTTPPTSSPSSSPPTTSPSAQPTAPPSTPPTAPPTLSPSTPPPTSSPTLPPTSQPTARSATDRPSLQLSSYPSSAPSLGPSSLPSNEPSSPTSDEPSSSPRPSYQPSSPPSDQPSSMPSTLDLLSDDWMYGGNGVSFPSETEVVLQSSSDHSSQFGVVLTTHAFNEPDVDFQVDYNQTSFAGVQSGYESQLHIFFVPSGTYPNSLLQSDNDFASFEALTVGRLRSKVFTTGENTWFDCATAETTQSTSISTKHLELSLRIRRLDNIIYAYYKVPGDETWTAIEQPMNISQEMHDIPIQFGYRVKKEWRPYHNFTVHSTRLAGGVPLPIPTKSPTGAPTETRTWIAPLTGTNYKESVCPTNLDRSSVSSHPYEVRGVGGGGAMSGLSISPWDGLWFVGTDMGTLFRSTDAGYLWYPVSHYEAKFYSRLIVSAPVGYTSDPLIVLHASCHEDATDEDANRDCVAQRSTDAGVTWSPVNITGGSRQDNEGNPVLDFIPKSWYGSLTQNSGIVYCTVFNSGNIYSSSNDGLTWSRLVLPLNTTNRSVGLYLDESATTGRYIYLATSHGIYMWKEGFENDAREIYASDGTILLQSFTGARKEGSAADLMLAFVDSDTAACEGDADSDCGYVHIFHESLDTIAAETHDSFTFTKTMQRGFRVASSRTDSDLIYTTGARSWRSATGTKVWVGSYDDNESTWAFSLKFQQYPLWDSSKLDYSGVGLDVGYWDGGYYRWSVKPNNFEVAGGSGNFFLHITRNGGDNWESPFTEYADGCNTSGERIPGRRWRSTGLEMTSVRWLKFNPYNTDYAFAAVADIRMMRSDDGGSTFEITGGSNTDPLFALNTVYDYDFAGAHTVFAAGGNFHDWPHEWYKNLRRGAGGVFVSFNSGDNWHRVGAEASSNCDDNFFNVDCSLEDDMVRQILAVHWDGNVGGGTLYIGSQSAGVARIEGLNDIFANGTIEQMQDLQWAWINDGLGTINDRIIPEIKERNGTLYCLLTGNAPHFNNSEHVGIYMFDHTSSSWGLKKGVVNHPSSVGPNEDLWAYPTSFDVDQSGNFFLVDIETNYNYLASGVWKSADDGATWDRVHQFTFPYHVACVGGRTYVSGARSISQIGKAGWGDGGALYSDDGGASWQKNEALPLLSNLNSVVVDPSDDTKVFYTFFGGGMMHGPRPQAPTQWSLISPLLSDDTMLPFLPTIPTHEDVSNQLYGESFSSESYPFKVHKITNFPEVASVCNADGSLAAALAGPKEICTADNCAGTATIGSEQCRAIINTQSIQLRSRFGTYWAKALGNPAWMQFIFHAVPAGSAEFQFSFKLDERYRPELYGGNPCSAASANSNYECQLCIIPGPWDHAMPAGVHVLWTAAGRSGFVVTGPFELGSAFDTGHFVQTHEAPPELNLLPGEFPVVTLFIAFQYPAMGEVANPISCSIDQSDEVVSYKDKPLMVREVSLMYRTSLEYSMEPLLARPRLYGNDTEWLAAHVHPFFDAPCDQDTAISNGGWFETEGFLSIKSHFDLAARGYISCQGGEQDEDIGSWSSLSAYFSGDEVPNQTSGFRAFHLLRRLWACANANNGNYTSCEYNATETSRLAAAVVTKEMQRFNSTTWTCGAICGGAGGDTAFDLTTAEQVSYFAHFFDVLVSQGLLISQDKMSVQTTLQNMIEVFVDTFWTGKWQLWNGNNWTPHLCVAALEWAIVFWHESNDLAVVVLRIVNDIMWLHRDYYTEDGVYTEGVAEYGFMSMQGQMAMAALSQASFGFSPTAIDVERVQRLASFFISSMSSDGYTIDFGDSHRKRGWTSPLAVIEAAIAPAIVNGETVSEASINSIQARALSAASYGSGGFYSNPWRIRGNVLQFDSLNNLRTPPLHESQPLGGQSFDIFPAGGYARILIPLYGTTSQNPLYSDLPSLWDNIPYSSIFLQARPNTYAHSEVDFGSFIWSAWGSRLISDFGYGTIATSVTQWDMRRYMYLDNNPAGHNTVIIREAFQAGSDTVNFSQLNYEVGTLSTETNFPDGSSCVLMDGSEIYGASRPDGWLDLMKRFTCILEGGSGAVLMLDIVRVKANRTQLILFGSQYGGPDFNEASPASEALTIDEYFYTDTEADVIEIDGEPSEVPFDRGSLKWCSHVNVELLNNSSSIALRPTCGIGGYRSGDGMGVISGISLASTGRFEYDGLVTSVNRWMVANALKKRRFRFVTDQKIDSEGDIRAFVLSPSLASNPLQTPPDVALEDCSNEHGCGIISSPISCSCVQMCFDQTLKRVTIVNGTLSNIENIGSC